MEKFRMFNSRIPAQEKGSPRPGGRQLPLSRAIRAYEPVDE